ncbi:hypothetical protein [Acinetobacter ursingii]|uniref:hypothetical protein n=1 Tax=Acinetobacter ursingii TaxID=108980 RepID=UPI0021CD6566|nr:hypothetical protein [Acinetobacter ursingii]MCU4350231.1 hypothetical protein [Acinetobacter ursingii]
MSSYRDDIQETAVASSSTLGRMKTLAEDSAKIVATLLFTLNVMHVDVAVASDEIIDSKYHIVSEAAIVSDAVFSKNTAHQFINDACRVSDQDVSRTKIRSNIEETAIVSNDVFESLRSIIVETACVHDSVQTVNHTQSLIAEKVKVHDEAFGRKRSFDIASDTLSCADDVVDKVKSHITESARISDTIVDVRHSRSIVDEKAKVKDQVFAVHHDLWADSVQINDKVIDQLKAKILIQEVAHVSDELDRSFNVKELVHETAVVHNEYVDHLHAKNLISDVIFVDDQIIDSYDSSGIAWTANADNWAMSRYEGYQFKDIAVINGVLYGSNDQGVFRLDAAKLVEGRVTTGKIDLGQGQLVHPVAAYLEYELSGNSKNLEIGVSTTQSGDKTTYFYPLPTEKSDYLTNGRVLFGRGLRGRHFAFEIKLTGDSGYINDLNIDIAATKRRV